MKKYTEALEIMLKHVAVKEILSGKITYDRFGKSTFVLLANSYHPNYSNDEVENLYTYFVDEMNLQKSRLFATKLDAQPRSANEYLNVFELLLQFSENVLLERGDIPVCNYSKLLRWRCTSHILDEDVFLASFLAYRDSFRPGSKRDLRWNLVTGSNNISLQQLLEKGIAENHFHLKGSAPYFHLSWISMMNDIDNPRFGKTLAGYDKRRLNQKVNYNTEYGEDSLPSMYLQAALIRLTLYMWLAGKRFVLGKCCVDANYVKTFFDYTKMSRTWRKSELIDRFDHYFSDYRKVSCSELLIPNSESINGRQTDSSEVYALNMVLNVLNNFWIDRKFLSNLTPAADDYIMLRDIVELLLTEKREIPLKNVKGLISEAKYLELETKATLDLIHKILEHPDMIINYQNDIHNLIQVQRWEQSQRSGSKEMLDYAIPGEYGCNSPYDKNGRTGHSLPFSPVQGTASDDIYAIRSAKNVITGERWLLYQMFKAYYDKKKGYSDYMNLFYAYLVIKETIRSEMIQVNTTVGFNNFSRYELRKEDFIEGTVFEKYFLKLAVWDIMKNRNIRSLEARISPKKTPEANASGIRKNDRLMDLTDDEKRRMFYVYHFVKAPEDKKEAESEILCRHYSLRNIIRTQAQAIARMREDYPEEASRVLGIDACNAEIPCRPEVFAQAFRFLRNHVVQNGTYDNSDYRKTAPLLGITYHVGEDFLDIIDGLRAIDEVCRFLNFKCGDRLGHALVMGINVREWYDSKDRRIFITKQAYLDNIVWVYTKIREIGLVGYEDLLLYIEKEYWTLFHEIYLKNIKDSYVNGILKKKDSNKHNNRYNKNNEPSRFIQFNITTYYDAWKLRGDDPECYIDGIFKEERLLDYNWEGYQIDLQFPEDYKLRLDFETTFLYHTYHYNPGVKLEGRKTIEVKISDKMIEVVEHVQKYMQQKIAAMGIGVEANPSSNYLIGTFKRYDKHPLLQFYNIGLTSDEEELQECPQISTSINTDDQGVFATSLENEYGLMVLALERVKDKNGKAKYSRERIYKWLDDIREMGLRQSFLRIRI